MNDRVIQRRRLPPGVGGALDLGTVREFDPKRAWWVEEGHYDDLVDDDDEDNDEYGEDDDHDRSHHADGFRNHKQINIF